VGIMSVALMGDVVVPAPVGESRKNLRESQRRVSVGELKGRDPGQIALERRQDDFQLIF
jgi:hypothetical protein